MLGCIQPMSSPMMNKMLGLVPCVAAGAGVAIFSCAFSCATAGVGVDIAAKARGTTTAKAVIAHALGFVLLLRFSVEGICTIFTGTSCHEVPPVHAKVSARTTSQSNHAWTLRHFVAE